MSKNIIFPIKNKFTALQVTQPDYEIDDKMDKLYVDINQYRDEGENFIKNLNYALCIENDKLEVGVKSNKKIIFSGHLGCGKTIELKRYHKYLDHPSRYFAILIEIEKELEIGKFQQEDFFVLLITKLVERIHTSKLPFKSEILDQLAKEWFEETEIVKEIKSEAKADVSSEAEAGISFWGFVKLKSRMKALFSYSSKTAEKIRTNVKNDPLKLIDRLNTVLAKLQEALEQTSYGKEILFIVDGSEKIRYELYEQLFIESRHLIGNLKVNMICSIPIRSAYNIEYGAIRDDYINCILPMVQVNKQSIPALMEIATKRIEKDLFFTEEALEEIVCKSGGCPRQLLRIVNRSLIESQGQKITLEKVKKSTHKLGQSMVEKLTMDHVKILQEKSWKRYNLGDENIKNMLLELVLLKYNGETKLNPLLEEFI